MDFNAAKPRKIKNKLFPCFRASDGSVIMDRSSEAADDLVSTYTAESNDEDHVAFSDALPMALSSESNDEGVLLREKKSRGSVFSRMLRAVFRATTLGKKIGKRKRKQKQKNSKSQISKSEIERNSIDRRIVSDIYCNSSSSSRTSAPFSSSFCSSCSSSIDINDKPVLSDRTVSKPRRNHGKTSVVGSGWFLLLVCLLSLIFSGKFLAVVCTSAWILFLPRQTIGFKSPADEGLA